MDQKKSYEKPKLGIYGDIAEVTRGKGDRQTDGGEIGQSVA